MDRVRRRVGDKRVLALVKAFLKSDILDEDGRLRDNDTGTPQGSILSPCSATWPSRSWTSSSTRNPAARRLGRGNGPSVDVMAY
jgi:hypothetical protein